MEPEPIKELITRSFMALLEQKPYARQPEVIHEFINALTTVGMVSKDKDDLASLSDSCHYWIDSNTDQQYTWEDYSEDYREELVDKDLGIVRKINLN